VESGLSDKRFYLGSRIVLLEDLLFIGFFLSFKISLYGYSNKTELILTCCSIIAFKIWSEGVVNCLNITLVSYDSITDSGLELRIKLAKVFYRQRFLILMLFIFALLMCANKEYASALAIIFAISFCYFLVFCNVSIIVPILRKAPDLNPILNAGIRASIFLSPISLELGTSRFIDLLLVCNPYTYIYQLINYSSVTTGIPWIIPILLVFSTAVLLMAQIVFNAKQGNMVFDIIHMIFTKHATDKKEIRINLSDVNIQGYPPFFSVHHFPSSLIESHREKYRPTFAIRTRMNLINKDIPKISRFDLYMSRSMTLEENLILLLRYFGNTASPSLIETFKSDDAFNSFKDLDVSKLNHDVVRLFKIWIICRAAPSGSYFNEEIHFPKDQDKKNVAVKIWNEAIELKNKELFFGQKCMLQERYFTGEIQLFMNLEGRGRALNQE
jgi:hypothetical protein